MQEVAAGRQGKCIFGILGGGWRSEFYLRIAKALPEMFEIGEMWMRDTQKAQEMGSKWGVKATSDLEGFLARRAFDFVVVSLPRSAAPAFILRLSEAGIPVLTETPPADSVEGLLNLYQRTHSGQQIQVAEQFIRQPLHAARLAVIQSGILGEISHVQVSAGHGYHGISLIRHLLGVGFEEVEISGEQLISPIIQGPGRADPPSEELLVESKQDLALLKFGGKSAVYDFSYDQYFSGIRRNRVLIRGCRGELEGTDIRYLKDYRTPVAIQMQRVDAGQAGNLEGYYHKGILAGGEWVYQNPFPGARLSDEELAMASCLLDMAAYTAGGPAFYSLAEACQDQYLSLLIGEAIRTRQTLFSERQIWAEV